MYIIFLKDFLNLEYALVLYFDIEGASWVQLENQFNQYSCDSWPCHSFLDATMQPVANPILFSMDSTTPVQISTFGLEISSTNNNTISVSGSQTTTDIGKLEDIVILPCSNIAPYISTNTNQQKQALEFQGLSFGNNLILYDPSAFNTAGDATAG